VQFLSIVYEDTEERIRDFLRRSGGLYPTLVDDAGKSAIAYGVYGVPETFFIDETGTIVAKHEGPLDANTLRGYLRKVMKP
jgi:cytochrome c biogenesis protein CcmG/thiol:disulfide interchange protein DsbE